MKNKPQIKKIALPHEWNDARRMVETYAESLEFDLAFQDFEVELESLPSLYGPPSGCFLLAYDDGAAGCVAVTGYEGSICEMKRLFVLPRARGSGLGSRLIEAIMEEARILGYRKMRLDTVPSMEAARALYRRFGFEEIEAYRYNPIEGTMFMERKL